MLKLFQSLLITFNYEEMGWEEDTVAFFELNVCVCAHTGGMFVESHWAAISLEPQCEDRSRECHILLPGTSTFLSQASALQFRLQTECTLCLCSLVMYFTFYALPSPKTKMYTTVLKVLRELLFPCFFRFSKKCYISRRFKTNSTLLWTMWCIPRMYMETCSSMFMTCIHSL